MFGKVDYAVGTWDRSRRVIIKAERLLAGPNRRFIVTIQKGDPQELYDQVYIEASRSCLSVTFTGDGTSGASSESLPLPSSTGVHLDMAASASS